MRGLPFPHCAPISLASPTQEFGERPDQFLPVMVNSVSSSMRRSFASSSGGSGSSSRAGGVPLPPVELPEVFGKLT